MNNPEHLDGFDPRKILIEECGEDALSKILEMTEGINQDVRNEWDMVLHIGGMDEGLGKSTLAQIIGILGDPSGFNLAENNIYIPDFELIKKQVYGLNPNAYINYDEAISAFSKLDRFKKWQNELIKLFTLCRKQYKVHMFCMPNIMDYNKTFRTRRIKYWIEITKRGHAVVIKRDNLPGNLDPWHIEKWIKWVFKKRGRRGYAKETSEELVEHLRGHPGFAWEFDFPKLPDIIYRTYARIAAEEQAKWNELQEEEEDVKWWHTLIRGLQVVKHMTHQEIADLACVSQPTITRNMPKGRNI